MVGVVLATHGGLADELLRTAEGVCGKLEAVRTVSISGSVPIEQARAVLEAAIHEVDQGDGVLVLTDMFGGTPSNLALTFLDDAIEVVTGVNLPMIMKLTTCRGAKGALREIAQTLTAHGQKNIALASELLRIRTGTRPG